MWKRIMTLCLSAALLAGSSIPAFAVAPVLNSEAACVIDADTGEILYEQNAQQEYPMASITKVMTALIVLENCQDISTQTEVTQEILDTVDPESTRIGFEAGEILTCDELMSCMLVDSANDAANILAACVGGSLEHFVQLMNEKAVELGCTHTHFMNPNGLDEDGHYTSAQDMAIITKAANEYPQFAAYSSQLEYELPADNVISAGWRVKTRVNMINPAEETYDARVYAAKTGWTTNATNTFTSCGKTETGANLIVTVLHCPVKSGIFLDTTALLNYVNSDYAVVTIPAEDYRKQAKKAAKAADLKLDTDALADITLRLPISMTTADLDYTSENNANGPCIAVMVSEGSRAKYTETTGMDGTQPLLTVSVPTVAAVEEPTEDTGSAVMASHEISDISEPTQSGLMAIICAVGAGLLLLLLTGMIKLIHSTRKKNKAEEQQTWAELHEENKK